MQRDLEFRYRYGCRYHCRCHPHVSEDGADGGILFYLVMIIVVAMLIQMAISRSREYLADEGCAHITGNPCSLASALRKMDAASQRIPL